MPEIIDAVGPVTGSFVYSIGGGVFGVNPYATGQLDIARERPVGTEWINDFGSGQVTNIRNNAPTWVTSGRVFIAMNERVDTGKTASQTWALAAADGASEMQTKMMTVITNLTNVLSGSKPAFQTIWLRIAREMGGAGNEIPILSDTDAANAVTFWRREIPRWRAAAKANGCTLLIHWNLCGGTDTTYQNATMAYPGSDMVDGIGPDTYDTNNTGIYPFSFAPYFRQSTLSTATVVGATSLVRDSNQVGPQPGDTVEIGTGTANVERIDVGTVSGTSITFKSALTKAHADGEKLTKVYAAGAKITQYGMTYISKVSSNATTPDPDPWTDTAQWGIYPFDRHNHGGNDQPGVNCMTAAERLIAIDSWTRAFRMKWFGEGTAAKWYVQKWYNFAHGIVTSDMTFDPRIPSPVGQYKAFIMPEIGCEGLPSTNYKGSFGGGDNFLFVRQFFAWKAAMKAQDPRGQGVAGDLWYNHDNGNPGAHTQAFTMLPPYGVLAGAAHGVYFPDAGEAYNECSRPKAQLRIDRRRGGVQVLAGTGSRISGNGGGGLSVSDTSGFGSSGYGPSGY